MHIRDQDRISLETIDGGGKHLAVIKEYYLECVSNCVLLHVFISNMLFPFLMTQSDGINNDCILAITNIAEDGKYAMVKSATHRDAHIRVLPSGQVEITTVTTQLIDNLLFRVPYIVSF